MIAIANTRNRLGRYFRAAGPPGGGDGGGGDDDDDGDDEPLGCLGVATCFLLGFVLSVVFLTVCTVLRSALEILTGRN